MIALIIILYVVGAFAWALWYSFAYSDAKSNPRWRSGDPAHYARMLLATPFWLFVLAKQVLVFLAGVVEDARGER